jgi:archaellum component FlaF (FlaF/FlaG flagellin family)
MSEPYGAPPPDEPIIGADTPPPAVPSRAPASPGAPAYDADQEDDWEDEYDDEEYGEYDDDGYYGDTPVRQPMFYVFLALAGVVMVVLLFLLFSFVKGGGDSKKTTSTTGFNVQIESPVPNQTIVVGRDQDVTIQAKATEAITRIQLYVNDRLVDENDPTEAPADGVYRANFRLQLPSKGDYVLYVKVTALSGGTKDSTKIKVHAVEEIGDRPVSIDGKVITPAVARTAPRDDAPEVRRLNPGETLKILGKTRDSTWLLVDIGGPEGRWVKRDAIESSDSLALVPVREATPTPAPSVSVTPSPSASATSTGTPNAPDFAPTNAVLIDGGSKLRITVVNLASSAYAGPLVIGVSGVPVDVPKQAFNVSIAANGSTTIDFTLSAAVTAQASARVQVDPDGAVKETNRDNNTATFVLTPPSEAPNLTITAAAVSGAQVNVTITNTGGELKSTAVTVRITFGAATLDQPQSLALAKGQSVTVSVPKPTGGSATAQLFIGGQAASSPFPFTVN